MFLFVVSVVGFVVFFNNNHETEKKENTLISTKPTNNFINNFIQKDDPVVLLFVGDMMFDRGVRYQSFFC